MTRAPAALTRRLLWNPILGRELRSRMRAARAPLTLTVFLVIVGGAGWVTYVGQELAVVDPYAPSVAGAQLFSTLFGCVIALTLLITPGLCASAISTERERQTLDLLLCTPMGAGRIVLGKLLSSMLFVLLLIAATVPLFALVFFLGGVTMGQVMVVLAICVGTALMAGTLGLFCSAVLRRTAAATLASYLLLFAILMLPVVFSFFSPALQATRVTGYTPVDCSASSLDAYGAQCRPAGPPSTLVVMLAATSPLTPTVTTLQTLPTARAQCVNTGLSIGVYTQLGCPSTPLTDRDRIEVGTFSGWRVWQLTLVGQAMVMAICLAGAVVALRGPRRRWRRPSAVTPAEPTPAEAGS